MEGVSIGSPPVAASRGQRDFSSVRGITAAHYDLIARDGTVDRTRLMLGEAGLLPSAL